MTSDDSPLEPERGRSRRAQVLDAAAECFRRYGFHGSSIARIGHAAGMSPGHIYHYFHNKEAIVAGIVHDRMAELFELNRRTREASSTGDPIDAFMTQVQASIELRDDRARVALDLEILAEAARNVEIGTLVEGAAGDYLAEMRELFAGIPTLRTLAPSEIDARIHTLGAMLDGLAMRSIFYRSLDRDAVAEVMKRVVRSLLA